MMTDDMVTGTPGTQDTDGEALRRPRVAVVGRPNVGKSTLVNRILGRRAAITQEQPGVTRDRVVYPAEWSGRHFDLVDTGGWEAAADGLDGDVARIAEYAMAEADLLLLVVDATVGATEDDAAVASRLRRASVPVLLVANKVDDTRAEAQTGGLWSLGLGEPHPVSALHGRGSGDLLDEVVRRLPSDLPAGEDDGVPPVALVGRPNVGKSSLLNRLAGEDLALVHEMPGTTRDAVDTVVTREDTSYRFVDTAGLRRSFARAQGADYYALVRSETAVRRADAAMIVLDATEGVAEQDQRVASMAVEAGCALVLVANKWDLMDDEARARLENDLARRLHFLDWAPLIRVSAKTGRGMDLVWQALEGVLAGRRQRVGTATLNTWLRAAVERTPPPAPRGGNRPRIRYVTQAQTSPPRFVFFSSARLPDTYVRYLEHSLRREFGFHGTPLRLSIRVASRQGR